jgi:hypothetical protein
MALYSELSVYNSTYDLLLAIFRFTKDFGKKYKYTVGESLKKETIENYQRNANSGFATSGHCGYFQAFRFFNYIRIN